MIPTLARTFLKGDKGDTSAEGYEGDTKTAFPAIDSIPYKRFSPAACEAVVKQAFNRLDREEELKYGLEIEGTLFAEMSSWSLVDMGDMLSKIPYRPGINFPMLYFSTEASCFALHSEDFDLSSASYNHFGVTKEWFVIPPCDTPKVRALFAQLFPEDEAECSEFLRHKLFMVSPELFNKLDITVHAVAHHASELLLTFPTAMHWGVNMGVGCAEAVNWCSPDWLKFCAATKSCDPRLHNDQSLGPEEPPLESGWQLLVDGELYPDDEANPCNNSLLCTWNLDSLATSTSSDAKSTDSDTGLRQTNIPAVAQGIRIRQDRVARREELHKQKLCDA